MIYPNDHEPAHVHVIGDGCEARFALDLGGTVELMENYGFSARRLGQIRSALAVRRTTLIEEWNRIHGD